jgi:hypothetical protein
MKLKNPLRKKKPYRMHDDSVTTSGAGSPRYAGKSVTARGERMVAKQGREPGRYDAESDENPDRVEGKSTARDVTSVRPLDPILDDMPNLR